MWRLWQLLRQRLPAGTACRYARIGNTLLHLGLGGWVAFMAFQCIWPRQCGEGFAAGYAAGAVGVMAALWSLLWLICEGLLLLCPTPPASRNAD